jgi:hypothetical protein
MSISDQVNIMNGAPRNANQELRSKNDHPAYMQQNRKKITLGRLRVLKRRNSPKRSAITAVGI